MYVLKYGEVVSKESGKFDPLRNLGTSKVFYSILLGANSPTEISNQLGINPPGVIDHLRKLQRMGIIDIGQKDGKVQHYVIDWRRVRTQFIERAPGSLRSRIIARRLGWEQKKDFERSMIEGYLKNFVADPRARKETYKEKVTVHDAMRAFENALVSVFPKINMSTKDAELTSFLKGLESWYNDILAGAARSPAQGALHDAFGEMGLLKGVDDTGGRP